MPHSAESPPGTLANTLPFPPTPASHILNCSFGSWYPRLKGKTPKARLVQLSLPFLDYLRADGIFLPPEAHHDGDSGYSDDEDEEDVSEPWSEVHQQIFDTIAELGGKVLPKLNWSAPKDATWILPTNDMECRTPNEVYLLLKSSDFITHDLEHPFDDCIDIPTDPVPYYLALRKSFNLNPSLEFRVFVRNQTVIAISQREMNHFPFLFELRNQFRTMIENSVPEFPDPNFVFDVYIPPPHEKVWIIDINPWAPRTDPLLFSWLELLTMDEPLEDTIFVPELRLVQRDDPEAYQFAATKYSAHKLPKDVVDAGTSLEKMKDVLEAWRKAEDGELSESDDE